MRSTNQVYLITILLYNHAQRIALGNPAPARAIGVIGRTCFLAFRKGVFNSLALLSAFSG